eukprot:m.156993 g.156993  ORF g.156993 m.156993 type:complete len:76 (+) comp24703_c0_seq1:2223-2450(+)
MVGSFLVFSGVWRLAVVGVVRVVLLGLGVVLFSFLFLFFSFCIFVFFCCRFVGFLLHYNSVFFQNFIGQSGLKPS